MASESQLEATSSPTTQVLQYAGRILTQPNYIGTASSAQSVPSTCAST
jgi:hypothetical protein